MHFRKPITLIGLSLAVLFSVVLPSSANAESDTENTQNIIRSVPNKITSYVQLKNTIKSVVETESYKNLSEEQKKLIINDIKNNASPSVYKTLNEKFTKTLRECKNGFSSDTGNDVQVLNVDDGAQIVVSTQDVAENQNDNAMITPLNMPEMYNVTKEYGARKYVIHAAYNIQGAGLLDERLTMHYSLGSYGIKMRSSSIAGSYVFGGNMDATSHVTDSVATHEGANVNAYADFKISFLFSLGGTRFDRIHGAVKLYKWYKSSKKMQLRESWYSE
ncbi:hypothetical protein NIE88_21620 [Sporolactobacillus shoreicorticis]|uniref:Bacterial toxin 44 domain-containing protein n=1 Tax=Sporolactobacillus shoreicorticis TaxID=1923877 RepID=A0ABW5RYP5_9BACL|nr:hypothetical protein [Sporolactobacillus shoreicorticis]MCO7128328.1 hypothetical protein [Sporolactobacillus shoreicorticis]